MEMRKEVEVLVDTVGLDDTLFALADHADAMALRLAALERGAAVETKPATVAVAPKVWPVGSKPPPGVGQVRRGDDGFTYRIVCVLPVSPCAAIRTDRGWLDLCGVAILAGAPLLEPWTEPAAAPADLRIAELEARIAALTAERDAAVKRAEEVQGYADHYDAKLTAVRVALDVALVPGVEPYPLPVVGDPPLSEHEQSLRAGGRVVPDPERVRRLAEARDYAIRRALAAEAERDAAVAKERADVVAELRSSGRVPRHVYDKIMRGAHVGASEK